MTGLLKQLLFVLEKLLTRNNAMHLNVRNVWPVITVFRREAIMNGVAWVSTKSHDLPLVFLPILSLMPFKVFILIGRIFGADIVGGRIFSLNPVICSLGGSLPDHVNSRVVAELSLHVHLKHLLLLLSLSSLQICLNVSWNGLLVIGLRLTKSITRILNSRFVSSAHRFLLQEAVLGNTAPTRTWFCHLISFSPLTVWFCLRECAWILRLM